MVVRVPDAVGSDVNGVKIQEFLRCGQTVAEGHQAAIDDVRDAGFPIGLQTLLATLAFKVGEVFLADRINNAAIVSHLVF